MFPFLAIWVAGAGVVAVLAGVRQLFQKPFGAIRRRAVRITGSMDGETMATLVFLAAVGCWLTITWRWWDVVVALEALRVGASVHSVDLSVLSSAARLAPQDARRFLHRSELSSRAGNLVVVSQD